MQGNKKSGGVPLSVAANIASPHQEQHFIMFKIGWQGILSYLPGFILTKLDRIIAAPMSVYCDFVTMRLCDDERMHNHNIT